MLNQPCFRLQEAYSLLSDSSPASIRKLLADMVKRGLLLRIKDGLYWIIPYEQEASGYFPNWHLVAKYLVGDAGYYIGYFSAMELHSLNTQPALVEQVVVDRQIKPATIEVKGVKFQFIYHNGEHFFGAKNMWIDGFNKVVCSDLEKTVVDGLYKPDYAGGIPEIAKALFKSKDRIDYEKLLAYCVRFNAQSVMKRLGFLLELLMIDSPITDRLHGLKTRSYALLEPAYEKKGQLNERWSIQQNMATEDITSPLFT